MTIKMSLHLSPKTNDVLEELCKQNHLTKSEFIRKSIALMQVALKNKEKGNYLVVVNNNGEKQGEIIGL